MANKGYYVAMQGEELNEAQKNALCSYILKNILQVKLSPEKALAQMHNEEYEKIAEAEIESGKNVYYGFVNPEKDTLAEMYADILDILEANGDNFSQIETYNLWG